jgi:hypothetical protein
MNNTTIITSTGAKILDVIWFNNSSGTIGIVLIETATGERKSYIKSVEGQHELGDTINVAEWGSTFPLESAYELFKQWKPENE